MTEKKRKLTIVGNFLGMIFCVFSAMREFGNPHAFPWIYIAASLLFFFAAVVHMSLKQKEQNNK
jgi:hypothetical protein